ncbi:type IV pilus biogenesis/stability protein PilW [Photobacterium carnosum]|uniref:Type IV pilus biogenesis/stability protein PilW n=1 Tax=Photobacterium carnosum TaxID=2023717 RepID=A0A2N4UMV9_9GAMM|nr:type IV pilus biogenesis/stability protein PilW [Photobacterium carnosum]KAE8175773.1 type IV pilus biogenesis/stability protein PilW [Photobacterium carnosum]MBY3789631.1 type IV pilus biogenesis/stability protein PilW [Photobacterium carnosum]MCD9496318.1 type IV pilus biogenesis/stability protein PilW [Photobacterium carnosum]MCD9499161.1 type IV pilus biogenesis/stability protein PilW [Photobacterium carnosum]MCD9515775.1 type IV pilus biogenesis/stability protein PilW [Photobacterium c
MIRWMKYPLFSCLLLAGCATVMVEDNAEQFNAIDAAEARMTLGLNYLKVGQWQRARDNLELALEYAPDYYRVQNAMAYYYQKVGEKDAAEKMYKQALKDAPKNGDVLNNYGAFLCSEGRYDEAINTFIKAINQPYYYLISASYENAGLCSRKQGNDVQAIDYFEKALSHDPYRPKSMLQLAQLELEANNYKDARVRLFKFNKRYGYTANSLLLLIQLENQNGRLTLVNKYANLLKEQFPDSQQYQNYLANEY